jgi:microcystin-dependent protein
MGEPYIGEIRMFAGNFAPAGWALAQGQLMPISQNDALFTLYGTMYGGDGQETFGMPNLASRLPIHFGTGKDGVTYQQAEMGGTESVTLTVQQIPVHNHALLATTDTATAVNISGAALAATQQFDLYFQEAATVNTNANCVLPAGGSQPHDNMIPFLVINYIVSLFGVYPSQT